MTQQVSDVVVHIRRPLAAAAREQLELALRATPGIHDVRGKAAQLLIVDFDRHAISALGVLRRFRALGQEAHLIGI
ncbi:MAG TPA: hypothetical protein VFV74_07905 [Burkholderiales bacterium]|nr:hypothetical protein [Burkholderiales bacterium]